MEGGKLIGKGGYGCVFHPHINCSGKTSTVKKYVSKFIYKSISSHKSTLINFTPIFRLYHFTSHATQPSRRPFQNNCHRYIQR